MEKNKDHEQKILHIDRKLNLLLGTFAIVVCILIFTSLENGYVTCKYFIPNIYLYVVLSILLVGIFTLLREKYFTPKDEQNKLYNYYDSVIGKYFAHGFIFGILAIILLIIYGFFNIHRFKNHYINHLFWIFILFGISSLFYPLFKLKVSYNYIDNAAVYVIMIFFVMSGIIYANYNKMLYMNENKFNWIGMGLLGALITIILANLLLIVFSTFGLIPVQSLFSFTKIILYFAIFIFSLYISYDTIYIIKRTKTCNTRNINNYPNYPMESFQIFIDLYNIFADLLHLQNLQSLTNYM